MRMAGLMRWAARADTVLLLLLMSQSLQPGRGSRWGGGGG